MKKYLITEEQRDFLFDELRSARNEQQWLTDLKPIEPLSNNDIDDYGFNMLPQVMRKDFTAFARVIEAHILGEKHENS